MQKSLLILIPLFILAGVAFFMPGSSFLGAGGDDAYSCTTSTVSAATVGNQVSSTVLAAYSRRAYARIQQPINATNTVALSLDEGAAATIGNGIQLTTATTTSPVQFIEFGLNTDNPYTGAVTGITNVGSTTILVTECRY